MKVLDLLNSKLYISTKPIYLMGFVILGVIVASFLFSLWVLKFEDWLFLWFLPAPQISNWGILVAALVAMLGWLVTSIITTRNSIKQHTVTTLLQTRLSAEYMKHTEVVNRLLNGDSDLIITYNYIKSNKGDIANAFSYTLNYVEFLSAGLRCGDFDNLLLKMTMKGIFKNLYQRCEPFIDELRTKNSNSLEHFVAVCEFWTSEEEKEREKKLKKEKSLLNRTKIYCKNWRNYKN